MIGDPFHFILARRAAARGNTWCASNAHMFQAETDAARARAEVERLTARQQHLTACLRSYTSDLPLYRSARRLELVAELTRSARDCRRVVAELDAAATARNVLPYAQTTLARVPRTILHFSACAPARK